jgi:NAD-dependent deacetylase
MDIPNNLVELIRRSANIAALTGAGISQESGLQTFRDKLDGIWAQYKPEDLATPEAFERNTEVVWDFYSIRRLRSCEVQPNPGHFALAEMEKYLKNFILITQNVDGLHSRAGSRNVLELHGNISRVKCSRNCGIVKEWKETQGFSPICPTCGAKLRPDVVWFGEMLPHDVLTSAMQAARRSDVFLSIGTSALVQPAATLPVLAKQNGAVIVEVNLEATPLTPFVDYFLCGRAGEVLPEMVRATWLR